MSPERPAAVALPRRRRLLFALVPSLLLLVALECAARVWERRSAASDRSSAAVVNAELLRRNERAEFARRDGETLVYVYGESTVFGSPVPEIGLVAQMQYYATRRYPGRTVRIVNLGIPGADSARLRDFVEATIGNRPDLAILLCGHNEFVRPSGDEPIEGALAHSAIARVVVGVLARASQTRRSAEVPPGFEFPFPRTGDVFRRRDERYRENVAAIVRIARDEGVPLVLTTLPSNLRDWPPVFRRLVRDGGDPSKESEYRQTMEDALADDEKGDVAALRRFVESWQARDPDDPMFRYLRARLRLADGDVPGAREDFVRARDLDPIPFRMGSGFLGFVRALARTEGTPLADLDAEMNSGGIPGLDLFVDNCHPTPEGAQRMAALLLRTAESAHVLPGPSPDAFPMEEFLRSAGYVPGSPMRLRYLVFNGQFAMRRPLYHYPIAARYLVQAVTEFPSAWVAHANLATLRLLQGDVDDGAREFARAVELHGGPLPLEDEETLPFLREILTVRGLR